MLILTYKCPNVQWSWPPFIQCFNANGAECSIESRCICLHKGYYQMQCSGLINACIRYDISCLVYTIQLSHTTMTPTTMSFNHKSIMILCYSVLQLTIRFQLLKWSNNCFHFPFSDQKINKKNKSAKIHLRRLRL